jgi:hypothetical protein
VNRKTLKQQSKPELSTDSLLKTSKKGDIELNEEQLGKVSAGSFYKVAIEYKEQK